MIEVKKASCSYGRGIVLKDVSFKVNNGSVYGIYGAEGSGKSALAAMLAGVLPAREGFVRINGFDVSAEPAAAKKCIGYLPQSMCFYPEMTVYELLSFVAEVKEVRDNRRFIHVHELMEQFSIEHLRSRRVGDLGAMELRRLGMAQACVGDPDILILDDPFSGLKRKRLEEMEELIAEQAEKGRTVFLTSSRPQQLSRLCHEVMLVEEGSVLPPVPTRELLTGVYLQLETVGDRQTVAGLLSGLTGLLSCSGTTPRYLLKAERDLSIEIRAALHEAGIMDATVTPAPMPKAEMEFRSLAGENAEAVSVNDSNESKEELDQ